MNPIGSLFTIYKDAVFQKDVEAFMSIYDENVTVFDMWQQWSYNGIMAWKEMVKGWFASLGRDRDVITCDHIHIKETGELALASAIVRYTAVSEKGEDLRYLENRLTWVAQKKDIGWKIIHQHTSGPIDFTTMKVILSR